MAKKDIECGSCGDNTSVNFGVATYATYNCGGCGASQIAFK